MQQQQRADKVEQLQAEAEKFIGIIQSIDQRVQQEV